MVDLEDYNVYLEVYAWSFVNPLMSAMPFCGFMNDNTLGWRQREMFFHPVEHEAFRGEL